MLPPMSIQSRMLKTSVLSPMSLQCYHRPCCTDVWDITTVSINLERTQTAVHHAIPRDNADCPSSAKVKLSTIVLRLWSVESLFPGMYSSNATMSRQGLLGDGGHRDKAHWYSSCKPTDSSRRRCNNNDGSKIGQCKSPPSTVCKVIRWAIRVNSDLFAAFKWERFVDSLAVDPPIRARILANPAELTPPRCKRSASEASPITESIFRRLAIAPSKTTRVKPHPSELVVCRRRNAMLRVSGQDLLSTTRTPHVIPKIASIGRHEDKAIDFRNVEQVPETFETRIIDLVENRKPI